MEFIIERGRVAAVVPKPFPYTDPHGEKFKCGYCLDSKVIQDGRLVKACMNCRPSRPVENWHYEQMFQTVKDEKKHPLMEVSREFTNQEG